MTRAELTYQRAVAALYAVLLPVLSFAQTTGTVNDEPPGGRPGTGGSGVSWIIILIAIAAIVWYVARRRTTHGPTGRPPGEIRR